MKSNKTTGRQVKTEKEKGQELLRSAYAKKYKLPVKAIIGLQRLKVISAQLADIKLTSDSDHYFLSRYSLTWAREEHVLAGLASKALGDRKILITPASEIKPAWHQWLNYEYGQAYERLYVSQIPLPRLKDLQHAVFDKFGVVITATQVGDIRKIAKRRYLNEVAGGGQRSKTEEIDADNFKYEDEIDLEELEIEAAWELEYGQEVDDETE